MSREAMVRQVIAHLVPEDAKPPLDLKGLAWNNECERIMRHAMRLLGLSGHPYRKRSNGVLLVYSLPSQDCYVFLLLDVDANKNKWYFSVSLSGFYDRGPRLSLAGGSGVALLVDAVCRAVDEIELSRQRLKAAKSRSKKDDDIPF
jgi:hypothetical protein